MRPITEILKRNAEQSGEKKPLAAMLITQNHDGSVTLEGPLQDRLRCLGLLEMAKVTITTMVVTEELAKRNQLALPPASGQPGNA